MVAAVVSMENVNGPVGTVVCRWRLRSVVDASCESSVSLITAAGRSLSEDRDSAVGGSRDLVDDVAGECLIGNEALVKHDKCSYFPPFLVSMHQSTTASERG